MFCFFVILLAEMKTVIGELLCAAAGIVFGKRKGLLLHAAAFFNCRL